MTPAPATASAMKPYIGDGHLSKTPTGAENGAWKPSHDPRNRRSLRDPLQHLPNRSAIHRPVRRVLPMDQRRRNRPPGDRHPSRDRTHDPHRRRMHRLGPVPLYPNRPHSPAPHSPTTHSTIPQETLTSMDLFNAKALAAAESRC